MTRSCSIDGCNRPFRARTWCNMHYQRWDRHGDPLVNPRADWGKPEAIRKRFWSRVDKGADDECWLWTGGSKGNGYGSWEAEGITGPHRYSWYLANGPIPDKMSIHHTCRVRMCVNSNHLVPVTRAANTIEALAYKADHARCMTLDDVKALVSHVMRKEAANG